MGGRVAERIFAGMCCAFSGGMGMGGSEKSGERDRERGFRWLATIDLEQRGKGEERGAQILGVEF